MRKLNTALLLATFLLPGFAFAQINKALADTLQSILDSKAKQYNVQSLSAAAVFPDGSVWEGAYGYCGLTPTTPDMLFEMGSNTKTYVASIILQMADEGKLSLSDTIYKFLPVHPDIAYGITIRQLLNHTSGIYDYTTDDDFFTFANGDPSQTVEVDYMLQNWMGPMQFTPGTKWSYCNTNYLLLGLIIEELDDVPFHQSLRQRILDEYNLTESIMALDESYPLPRVGTWLNDGSYFEEEFKSFMSAAWAAGAILTTPADLAKWAKMLYSGDVLPGSWLDSMRVTIAAGNGYRYGLGMFQYTSGGKIYLGHGGTTLQNSEMNYSVSSDFSVVTVINEQSTGGIASTIQRSMINAIEKLLPGVTTMEPVKSMSVFSCYPNPANGNFTIKIDEQELESGLQLQIYSATGALVKTEQISSSNQTILANELKSGIYQLLLQNNSGEVIARDKLLLY